MQSLGSRRMAQVGRSDLATEVISFSPRSQSKSLLKATKKLLSQPCRPGYEAESMLKASQIPRFRGLFTKFTTCKECAGLPKDVPAAARL